jgi:hypothetical protein
MRSLQIATSLSMSSPAMRSKMRPPLSTMSVFASRFPCSTASESRR